MDFNQVPKQFCDDVTVGFRDDTFAVVLRSGNTGHAFAFSPEHTKRLAQYLTYQVEQYEKKYQEIDAVWSPNIQSPIQPDDLNSPGTGKGTTPKK